MENISIDVREIGSKSYFMLSGAYSDILANRRLLLTLKRLNYQTNQTQILIPFRKENQIQILQEIQSLLVKYGFKESLSNEARNDLESYNRENILFEMFSSKAKAIRNNEFNNFPELVENYKNFKLALNKSFTSNWNLYPLQELSAFHMAFSQNSCNFSVPGAGKTSIVYGAYAYLKSLPNDDPRHIEKLLVIGPLSSFAPWINEYRACFGKSASFQRLSGDISISKDKKLEHLYSGAPAEITLIFHGGVDSLQNDIIEFLKKNKTMVVVDEAHRIKNPEGIWGRSVVEISKEAKARIILTGTPVPNGYQDLYNLYKFIYPFKYKEILKVHYQNLEEMTNISLPGSSKVQTLKDNVSPFFIRIKKDDLKLPPISERIIKIDMEPFQREIYDFIETSYVNSFKENESATIKDILNRAKLIRLRQASTNPALLSKSLKDSLANNEITGEYDPNAKFTTYNDEFINDSEFFNKITNYSNFETPKKYSEIKRIIESEILPDGKVIIWTIFIQNAKELKEYLLSSNIQTKLLIGEIEQTERENTIEKFNNPDNNEFQVIIANPFSVAESISLHKGCHNAIYLERDYNCSNFLQSKDRIHRVGLLPGQITTYYYVISKDSIDEVIDIRLKTKIERMEKIINDDIPLFNRINEDDETDIIKDLIANYAKKDLKSFENLGSPQYFYELFTSIVKDETISWTIRDAEQLFYNKNIEGRTIFDGCLVLAFKISILKLDESGNILIHNKIKDFLFSEKQMCDKFVDFLFQSLNQDEVFHSIFSSEYLSYDIIYHSTQIDNSAFGFRFSNFKQLLIDFDVIQIHPTKELSKFILNSRYKKIFDKIVLPEIKKRKIGVDEFRKSMELQQIYGEEAEAFVLNFEKQRLENKEGIDWVAEYSIAEGYDISSFQNKESKFNDCFIEVKSYSGKPYFFWSRNEIDISRIKGNKYFLYLVDRNHMKDVGYKPIIIQNPYKEVLDNRGWVKQVEKYKIELNV